MRKHALLLGALGSLGCVSVSHAFSFEFGEFSGSIKTAVSVGATWSMQDADQGLLGKLNVPGQAFLCDPGAQLNTTNNFLGFILPALAQQGGFANGADPIGSCALSNYGEFLNAPGSFTGHGTDDGRLNYDKHDLVAGAAKITTDYSISYGNFRLAARTIVTTDPVNTDFEERHPQDFFSCNPDPAEINAPDFPVCGAQPARTQREKIAEDQYNQINLETFYFEMNTELFDRPQTFRIGKQIVRWGESLALPVNSINTINVPDVQRLRTPGFVLGELFDPINMFSFSTDITDALRMQAIYMLEWEPVRVVSPGTFYSPADVIGVGLGRDAATLGLGFSREDPSNLLDDALNADLVGQARIDAFGRNCFATLDNGSGITNVDGIQGRLNQGAHRGQMVFVNNAQTAYDADGDGVAESNDGGLQPIASNNPVDLANAGGRQACVSERAPDNHGQWGVNFGYYAENLGGSQFGFYYLNYHSRLPYASVRASQAPRESNAGAALTAISGAAGIPIPGGIDPAEGTHILNILDALTVADTLRVEIEYPEDIEMFGFSFNTNLGDYSVAFEYAYRPEMPLQVYIPDLIFYGQSTVFREDRCYATPSVIEQYRHTDYAEADFENCPDSPFIAPGQYLQGYELFPVGQANMVILHLAETNPFGADTWIRILDVGATKVFGLPDKSRLLLAGAGAQTNGLPGRLEFDSRNGTTVTPNSADDDGAIDTFVAGTGCDSAANCSFEGENTLAHFMLNPRQEDDKYFGDSFSWGYRFINILTYEQVLSGTLQFTFAFFHDVNGITPGPATNFIEDRKTYIWATEYQYQSWKVNTTYVWNTGAGRANPDRDRDTISLALTYTF